MGGHLFGQVDTNLREAGTLRVLLMGSGTDFDIPKSPLDVDLRPLANPSQRTRQQTAIVSWTRALPNHAFEASFYERWSRAELLPSRGPLTASAAFDRTTTTLGVKADITAFSGRHAVKTGVDAVRLAPRETLAYDYSGYRALAHLLEWPHLHFPWTWQRPAAS